MNKCQLRTREAVKRRPGCAQFGNASAMRLSTMARSVLSSNEVAPRASLNVAATSLVKPAFSCASAMSERYCVRGSISDRPRELQGLTHLTRPHLRPGDGGERGGL